MKRNQRDRVLLRLVKAMKPIAHWLLLAAILDVLAVICAVVSPELLGDIVDLLYAFWEEGTKGEIHSLIAIPLLVLLGVYGANNLLSYLNMRLMNQVVSTYFSCDFRIKISEKLKRLPVRYVDQTPVGDILSRMTGDVSEIGGYVHTIFDTWIKGIFQILMISVFMFMEDWRLALFVLILTPASLYLSSKIASVSEKYYDDMFERSGDMTGFVEESFSNYPTTKAYNLEEYSCSRHDRMNDRLRKATVKANFTGAIVQPLIKLSNAIAYILINLIGGYLVVSGDVSVGVVVTIVLFARQFSSPLEQLAYGFSQINRVKAAARRVFSILDMDDEVNPPVEKSIAPEGAVSFRNVAFSYKPEEPLIRDLNLSVRPGQKVAIVGPTGAGKTTIVNLLMRFYDPTEGEIFLDGKPISGIHRDQVRACFGMVLQDTWLFRGTIAENVAFGKPDATAEEIRSACQKAHCDHFIRTMPDGYETVIGEDNSNISGGQRQLLTIARAILADRPLLILDEATSNVDTRTEIMIQKAMDELMKGKTCFVIAHRLSTIVDSDVILVLDHGKLVEQGTHTELLERRGFYYKLFTSQYSV